MTTSVDDVVETFRDLCARFDVDSSEEASAQLRSLLAPPWNRFRSDSLVNRSALTDGGAPFELSVKIEIHGNVTLRYVVDTADPTLDIDANVGTYIMAAQAITGLEEQILRQLFATHLKGCGPNTRPTVMHGVGLAAGVRQRSSLYFPAGWLDVNALTRRLPGAIPMPSRAQVVAYDFNGGELTRWKTYHWLPVDSMTGLAVRPEIKQHIPSAAAVYDRFASSVEPQSRGTATFLQRAIGGRGLTDRIFFFTRPWGWTSQPGLTDLLRFLDATIDIDLDRTLRMVREAMRRRGLAVHLAILAVGDNPYPSLTLYFWPK